MTEDWVETLRREERAAIRQRVQLALLPMALLAIVWTVLAGFVYHMERAHTLRVVDHQLSHVAQSVSISKQHIVESSEPRQPTDVHLLIWSPLHQIVAHYQPFPRQETSALRRAVLSHQSAHPVYYSMTVIGIPYRVRQWPLNGHLQGQLFDDIQDDQSRLDQLLVLFVWSGVIGLVLSLAGGFLMGLWTLQPIFLARRREQAFLSDVAHELRTPLAAMSARVELLIRHVDDPIAAHLPWIETVYSETQRMTRLVNDLLDVGRLDEGRHALSLDLVSLKDLCLTVDGIYRPVLEEAGLALVLALPVDALVLGDALRLRQLLLIFLDNAVKHTQSGKVTLAVVVRGTHADLHVTDTGQGMPMVLKPTPGPTNPTQSHGLGLVIARKIVGAHGARLAFTSTPGVGTDVVVTFRTVPPGAPRPKNIGPEA